MIPQAADPGFLQRQMMPFAGGFPYVFPMQTAMRGLSTPPGERYSDGSERAKDVSSPRMSAQGSVQEEDVRKRAAEDTLGGGELKKGIFEEETEQLESLMSLAERLKKEFKSDHIALRKGKLTDAPTSPSSRQGSPSKLALLSISEPPTERPAAPSTVIVKDEKPATKQIIKLGEPMKVGEGVSAYFQLDPEEVSKEQTIWD